jgi:hypothetical protein
MKRLFVVCLFLSFGLAVSAWGADPFVGTWKVNTEKSKASTGQPGAKEEVVKIEEQGGNLLVTIKGTSAAGKAYSDQYTVPRKGGRVTYISEAPATHFDEMKRIDEHTLDATMIRDGKVVQTVHGTVSPDGKTITLVGKGTDGQGRPLEYIEVQERQ